ncbi:MAG: hypothetical protein QOK37_356 [Thermoanaerobaculia bacterium]|nr:hypothetical protein [Thermoanaerobaculia bacterium]
MYRLASIVLTISVLAPFASAQGTIPVTSSAALGTTSGEKAIVTNGNTLNVVFLSGGKLNVDRSIGGGPWETPTIINGTITGIARWGIAAASDGTVAVAFTASSGLFYTYKPPNGDWTTPFKLDDFWDDVAIVAAGTQVHIAASNVFDVVYKTFPIRAPNTFLGLVIAPSSLCCAAPHPVNPSIAVSTPAGGPTHIFVAFAFVKDATKDSCSCPDKGSYSAGIRVYDTAEPDFPAYEDVRKQPTTQAATINAVSMSSNASGDIFLAYSDQYCVVQGLNCIAPDVNDPPARTKLARFNASTQSWLTSSVPGGNQLVDIATLDASAGANVRLARHLDPDFKPGCRLQDFDWHGAATTPTAQPVQDIADCPAAPQALFFRHACGSTCEVRMLYADAAPVITTLPGCSPTLLPDLTIRNLTASGGLHPGGVAHISYEVFNDGSAASVSTISRLFDSSNKAVAQKAVDPLQPGGTTTISTDYELPSTTPTGKTNFSAVADFLQSMCEGDELNNRSSLDVNIQAPPVCTFSGCGIHLNAFLTPGGNGQEGFGFTASPGVRGCAFPPTTTFAWYQSIGGGPETLIQSSSSNTIDFTTTPPYVVRVEITNGSSSCTVSTSIAVTNIPLSRWVLVVLALALGIVGLFAARAN